MPRKYRLVGKEPVYEADLHVWAYWYQHFPADRVVANDVTPWGTVSSVFTGLEQTRRGSTPPLVFETLVSGGPLNGTQRHTASWDDCERAHREILGEVKREAKRA